MTLHDENRRFRFDLYMSGPDSKDRMQSIIRYALGLEDDNNRISTMNASLIQDAAPPKSDGKKS